jgi:diguanylate cyclase (GGDEF)-like protein
LALTDDLTGLPNRRAVDVWVSRQLSAAARHDFPMWIVIADLDHFKRINDTYGHEAGDAVIKGFAEVLKRNTRSSNICARLGGEEFLIVITHVETKDNMTIAVERVRRQFADLKFNFRGETVSCTASFGVAGFRGNPPPNFTQLTARADAALYAAKNNGRNRMEFAE